MDAEGMKNARTRTVFMSSDTTMAVTRPPATSRNSDRLPRVERVVGSGRG
jgi:hypothetical protein